MGFLDEMFGGGGGPNPADEAQKYINQVPGIAQRYLNPYIQHGQNAYDIFSGPYQQMAQDPSGFINALMQKYKPSENYKLANKAAQQAESNTAAAGGMRGSVQDIDKSAQISNRLMDQDMQQWLQNALGVQSQGLNAERGMYGQGYDASKQLVDNWVNALGQQGQYAFQGQREANQDNNDIFGSIAQGLGFGAGEAIKHGWF